MAIDGSKFKAVNNRDKNFTPHKLKARMQQLEESIARYLADLDRADRDPSLVPEGGSSACKEKIATVRDADAEARGDRTAAAAAPDQQVSLTDPDARSMATSGRGTGIVGYNVQTAVDTKHHLIVAHEVTNVGHDRSQLATMAEQTQEALGTKDLTVIADRGYFSGEEILKCEQAGIDAAGAEADHLEQATSGRFDKRDFTTCRSATHTAARRASTRSGGSADRERPDDPQVLVVGLPEVPDLQRMHDRATTDASTRWEHEAVLERMQRRTRPHAAGRDGSDGRRSSIRSGRSKPGWARPTS